MMFLRPTMVLYVGNQTAVASLWHGQHYQSHQVYQHAAEGHAAFRQALLQHRKATVHVIVDVVEEAYQLITLPHVTGAAKQAVLTRKLQQFDHNSEYKAAWLMWREKAARDEDAYVLLALTNTDYLQEWMTLLQSEQALVAGVTTLPMVSQGMLSAKELEALLLCERTSSGLRLSYFQHERLRVSRLLPMAHLQPASQVGFYLAEIEKMRLYLLSQKVVRDVSVLQVRLSAFGAESDGVATGLTQRGLQCSMAKQQDEVEGGGLRQADVVAYPELLHMQWLTHGRKLANLAPVEMTKHYCVQRLTSYLMIGAIALILSDLLAGLYFLHQGDGKSAQIQTVQAQTTALLNQKVLAAKTHAEMRISSRELKNTVITAKRIRQLPASPLLLMQVVSAALADEPTVEAHRMRWLQSEQLQVKDEGVITLEESGSQHHTAGLVQIGFLNAAIQPFTGDYPTALLTAKRLVEKLRRDAHVMSAQLLQAPVNTISLSPLQGNTSEQTYETAVATFKLKITLKPTRGAHL